MSKPYIVKAGDTLSQIAQKNGFKSWHDLYDAPDNRAFRAKRPDPNRIFPGDVVILPFAGASSQTVVPPPPPPPPADLNLFLNPNQRLDLDKLIHGLGPRLDQGDPLRDLDRALKELGPEAKKSNSIDDLAKKVQKHMEVQAGDWTIKPDLGTIGKGLLELLKRVK